MGKRNLYKKLVSGLLVVAMVISTNMSVHAKSSDDSVSLPEMQDENVVLNEIEPTQIDMQASNVHDRQYEGDSYSITDNTNKLAMLSASQNADPNSAYMVSNDTVTQGVIEKASEMRWYRFTADSKTKVTILTQMESTLDADIYVFKLNGSKLDLVDGSATEGLGLTELFKNTLEAGTYFFAISGYNGTGAFAFAFYESYMDAANEMNDDASTATAITFGNTKSGIIDSPYDVDYYSFSLTKTSLIKYSISAASDYKLDLGSYTGSDAGGYVINAKYLTLKPGTYYFAVYSPSKKYSATTEYTVDFQNIGYASADSTASYYSVSEDAGVVFQSNPDGTNCYVNGNPIDYSYSYLNSMSNQAGSQRYDIQLHKTDTMHVCLYQSDFSDKPELQQTIPDVACYHSSTFTGLSLDRVLTLSLYDKDHYCYSIHNVCSGAYKGNTLYQDLHFVNVFINPDTGKIIDIEWYNYFYNIGSQSITYFRPYKMKYYYPYYNRTEPIGGDGI